MNCSVTGKVRAKAACVWFAGAVVLSISAPLFFAGCAGYAGYDNGGRRVLSTAPQADSTPPTMTAPEALQKIREGLQSGGDPNYYGYQNINVTLTQFTFTEVHFHWPECKPETHTYSFNELDNLVVRGNTAFLVDVPRQGGYWGGGDAAIVWMRDKFEYARGFADAVNAMKYYASGSDVADDVPIFAKFQEDAKAWRALPDKPALPEDVQRFRVAAEDAFNNKDLSKAVGYYEQGLAIEPLWSQGQYNVALLYGELQLYDQAGLHMKRYLELVPDAKNADFARNKMYLWEVKAKENGVR
jgi:tetratricopeptide (TPR) repeat protein